MADGLLHHNLPVWWQVTAPATLQYGCRVTAPVSFRMVAGLLHQQPSRIIAGLLRQLRSHNVVGLHFQSYPPVQYRGNNSTTTPVFMTTTCILPLLLDTAFCTCTTYITFNALNFVNIIL